MTNTIEGQAEHLDSEIKPRRAHEGSLTAARELVRVLERRVVGRQKAAAKAAKEAQWDLMYLLNAHDEMRALELEQATEPVDAVELQPGSIGLPDPHTRAS